jgi:hypothetical protein
VITSGSSSTTEGHSLAYIHLMSPFGPERTNREAPGAAAIGSIADIGL